MEAMSRVVTEIAEEGCSSAAGPVSRATEAGAIVGEDASFAQEDSAASGDQAGDDDFPYDDADSYESDLVAVRFVFKKGEGDWPKIKELSAEEKAEPVLMATFFLNWDPEGEDEDYDDDDEYDDEDDDEDDEDEEEDEEENDDDEDDAVEAQEEGGSDAEAAQVQAGESSADLKIEQCVVLYDGVRFDAKMEEGLRVVGEELVGYPVPIVLFKLSRPVNALHFSWSVGGSSVSLMPAARAKKKKHPVPFFCEDHNGYTTALSEEETKELVEALGEEKIRTGRTFTYEQLCEGLELRRVVP